MEPIPAVEPGNVSYGAESMAALDRGGQALALLAITAGKTAASGVGSMIKSELIAKLAEENPHLHQRDVERIVSTIFDEITGALSKGERVELRGFGAFSVKRRPARVGRNPRTGESVQVDEKFVPFFKTGKELRERLNDS